LDNPFAHIEPERLKYSDGNETDYEYFEQIGEGAFSKVYIGQRVNDSKPVVLKKLKAPKPRSVNREIMVLSHLRNVSKHIVNMIDAVRDYKNDSALLVFEYMESISFAKVAPSLNLEDIRHYMFQLVLAIEECHQRGVMHRDIKMTNTIVNEEEKLLILIDWGLGEFYHPGKNYSTRVGTRYYKAPELLLGNEHYDYAVDLWSFGSIFAGLVMAISPNR
jgi:casein kinase II subunit alpha